MMRPNNFDLLRLLAALQVVYCHTIWHLGIRTGLGDPWLSWIINWFPGVPIFFTISGFLISRSWERSSDWRDYATKRALRIYPALWVQLAVGITLAACFGFITTGIVTSGSFAAWIIAQTTCLQFYNPSFLRGFGLGALNGSLWTIPVELGFYLTLPLLYAGFVNRVNRRLADIGLLSLSLASFAYWFYLSTYADPESNWTKLQMVSSLPHLYMFLLGVVLQRNSDRILPLIENRALFWMAAFAVCMVTLNPWSEATLSPWPLAVLLGRVLLAMAVLSVAFSWRSFSVWLLRENDISYGVYLYHGLAINALVQLGWKGESWQLGLVVGVTIALATLSWRLIERPAVSMKSIRRPHLPTAGPVSIPLNVEPLPTLTERRAA